MNTLSTLSFPLERKEGPYPTAIKILENQNNLFFWIIMIKTLKTIGQPTLYLIYLHIINAEFIYYELQQELIINNLPLFTLYVKYFYYDNTYYFIYFEPTAYVIQQNVD